MNSKLRLAVFAVIALAAGAVAAAVAYNHASSNADDTPSCCLPDATPAVSFTPAAK